MFTNFFCSSRNFELSGHLEGLLRKTRWMGHPSLCLLITSRLYRITFMHLKFGVQEEEEEAVSSGSDFSSEDYEFDYVSADSKKNVNGLISEM